MLATLRNHHAVFYAALALGLCADYLFYERAAGISVPLFVALALALRGVLASQEGRAGARGNAVLAAAALFFAACLAWRASPTLTALNTLALLGLLLLSAVLYGNAAALWQPPAALLARLVGGVADAVGLPPVLAVRVARDLPREPGRIRNFRPVGCGLLLALPVLAVFTVLLASADTVFASYVDQLFSFELPFDLASLFGHAFFIGAMAWVCAGGLLVALLGGQLSAFGSTFASLARAIIGIVYVAPGEADDELPAEGDTQELRLPRRALISLGAVEALTVLGAVDLLFGSFMAIQGAYFFGGLDTLARTGMTYAEYARRGFFELLAVACLALALLCALAVVTRREGARERRIFLGASAAMIALVLGLLASAFQRMALYEAAYGYTELRIYTHSFMIWLAALLGLFLLALLRNRAQMFVAGGLASALVYVALLNLANPDALIVRENIGRLHMVLEQPRGDEQVDAYYLTQLSPDATPTLIGALGQLDSASWQTIAAALAEQHAQIATRMNTSGWPAWHLGRAQAQWAIERAGLATPGGR
jgi:hypothetical protein